MQARIEEGEAGGYVELSVLLQFNRMRALRCLYPAQLAQAIRKSDMLTLSEDKARVRRDTVKFPLEDVDSVPRTIYVEGFPVTSDLDDLSQLFARHGRVRLVEIPRHRLTREPRGFCFVEFATEEEAREAAAALQGSWPSTWPARQDGGTLRAMPKERWMEYKREYQALQRPVRGGDTSRASRIAADADGDAAAASTIGADAATAHGAAVASDGGGAGVSSSCSTAEQPPRMPPGCLLRISGFSLPQTVLSIREFAEHAVPVEYCDFRPGGAGGGAPVAHLRLRSPDDCMLLLEDLRITRRMLGWLRPHVCRIPLDEENLYWREVNLRRVARDSAIEDDPRQTSMRPLWAPNPQGTICRGPVKKTSLQRYRSGLALGARAASALTGIATAGAAGLQSSGSFIDTITGNAGFGPVGLGRPRRKPEREARRKRKDTEHLSRSLPPHAPGAGGVPRIIVIDADERKPPDKRGFDGPAASGEPPAKAPRLPPCTSSSSSAAGEGAVAAAGLPPASPRTSMPPPCRPRHPGSPTSLMPKGAKPKRGGAAPPRTPGLSWASSPIPRGAKPKKGPRPHHGHHGHDGPPLPPLTPVAHPRTSLDTPTSAGEARSHPASSSSGPPRFHGGKAMDMLIPPPSPVAVRDTGAAPPAARGGGGGAQSSLHAAPSLPPPSPLEAAPGGEAAAAGSPAAAAAAEEAASPASSGAHGDPLGDDGRTPGGRPLGGALGGAADSMLEASMDDILGLADPLV